MIMNIYVGNLSFAAADETLRQAFEAFGQVTSATVVKDKYSGQSRGFGFVEMPIETQAQTAIKSLNGKDLMGREIKVEQAHDSAGRGRTGGRTGVAVAGIVMNGCSWSALWSRGKVLYQSGKDLSNFRNGHTESLADR